MRASGLSSYLISREGMAWGGFSHVLALLPDGSVIDSRSDAQPWLDPESGKPGAGKLAGVRWRPNFYERWVRLAVVEIPCTERQAADWEGNLRSKIGDPYDPAAILGFIFGLRLHKRGHFICSALQAGAQRRCGLLRNQARSIIPPSGISPDMLFALDTDGLGGTITRRYGF